MNYYEAWFTLKDSGKDLEFVKRVDAYLGYLKDKRMIEDYALKRRKLGFGPPDLGDFNITIAVRDLTQLDEAFSHAATRGPDVEPLHAGVYAMIENVKFALYRDFPDPQRRGLKT